MIIKNFKMDGMEQIATYLEADNGDFSNDEIKNLLSTINVSFVAVGISRALSTLLCELKDSYVQQSQRYCNISESGYTLSGDFNRNKEAVELINKSFSLYIRMTELKDKNITKPTINDFKYGIPYEDARYILPLACNTNISVSMSGDKLIDLFILCEKYINISDNFYYRLRACIDNRLIIELDNYINSIEFDMPEDEMPHHHMFDIIPDGGILRIHTGGELKNICIGALTSTTAGDPVSLYESYGEDTDKKAINLMNRVAFNYGHVGILEQYRNTYGFSCSLSAYHQVIRHRIATMYRQPFISILSDPDASYYVPDTILGSKFETEYRNLVQEYMQFIASSISIAPVDVLMQYLLNCIRVKFISSSNARNDMYIFRERLCNRAQAEIRHLYEQKYNDLMDIMPELYSHAGPPCIDGTCKEGKMTCGKPFNKREVNV